MTIEIISAMTNYALPFLAISLVFVMFLIYKGFTDYSALVFFILMLTGKMLVLENQTLLTLWNVFFWLSGRQNWEKESLRYWLFWLLACPTTFPFI